MYDLFGLSMMDMVGCAAALIMIGSMFATLFESRGSYGFRRSDADLPRPGAQIPPLRVAANDDQPFPGHGRKAA